MGLPGPRATGVTAFVAGTRDRDARTCDLGGQASGFHSKGNWIPPVAFFVGSKCRRAAGRGRGAWASACCLTGKCYRVIGEFERNWGIGDGLGLDLTTRVWENLERDDRNRWVPLPGPHRINGRPGRWNGSAHG